MRVYLTFWCLVSLALPLTLPLAAQADCVTSADLGAGIEFRRQDGHEGLAQLRMDRIALDYASDAQTYLDRRDTVIGIYEIAASWLPYEGEAPEQRRDYSYRFSGQPPVPAENIAWKSVISVVETRVIGPPKTYDLAVTYSFKSLRKANLSGCSYDMLPVEAHFLGEGVDFTRHWSYFPELTLGLETRVTDALAGTTRGLGLTELTPAR